MSLSRSLVGRMVRAARLEVNLYEEVEVDATALPQALLVVIIANLAIGLGSALGILITAGAVWFPWAFLWGFGAIVGWFIWGFIVYLIGTRIFRGTQTSATYGELLRTIGFSASPGVIGFFRFIPLLGFTIWLAAVGWQLVAMVIAARQALDFTTGRAIGTCLVGFAGMAALFWGIRAAVGLAGLLI